MTIDHIVPKSLGGSGDIKNLRPLCLTCNSKRGISMTLEEKRLYIKDCLCNIIYVRLNPKHVIKHYNEVDSVSY